MQTHINLYDQDVLTTHFVLHSPESIRHMVQLPISELKGELHGVIRLHQAPSWTLCAELVFYDYAIYHVEPYYKFSGKKAGLHFKHHLETADTIPWTADLTTEQALYEPNKDSHIHLSAHLQLMLDEQRLKTTGDIQLHEGELNFLDNRQDYPITADLVLNHAAEENIFTFDYELNNIKIQTIQAIPLRSQQFNTAFKADLSLNYPVNDEIKAQGQIELEGGKTLINGQTYLLQQGQLYYDGKQSIDNPSMEIYFKSKTQHHQQPIHIYGTLDTPQIENIGITQTENKHQSNNGEMVQTAMLFSQNALQWTQNLQRAFHIDHITYQNNQGLTIGKRLHQKILLEYWNEFLNAEQGIKLKLQFNKHLALSLQTAQKTLANTEAPVVSGDLIFEWD